MSNNNFSSRLKALRIKKGLKQNELADILGFTAATYNRYEKGVSIPKADNILALADFFGVSPDYLLYGDNDNTPQNKDNSDLLVLLPTKENIEKYPEYFDYVIDDVVDYLKDICVQYDLKTKEKITIDRAFFENADIDFKVDILSTLIECIKVDKKNEILRIYYLY